jgi:hypothetical protein
MNCKWDDGKQSRPNLKSNHDIYLTGMRKDIREFSKCSWTHRGKCNICTLFVLEIMTRWETYVTPTNAIFCNLCVLCFTQNLADSILTKTRTIDTITCYTHCDVSHCCVYLGNFGVSSLKLAIQNRRNIQQLCERQLFMYLMICLLTPWSRFLLENLTGSQLVQNFPAL